MGKKLISAFVLIVGDTVAFMGIILMSRFIRFNLLPLFTSLSPNPVSRTTLAIFAPLWIIEFLVRGLYTRRRTFQSELKTLLLSHLSAWLFLFALSFLLRFFHISRGELLIIGALGFVVFPVERYFTKWLIYKIGIWKKRVAIIYAEEPPSILIKSAGENFYLGYYNPTLIQHNPHRTYEELRRAFHPKNTGDLIIFVKGIPQHELELLIEKGSEVAETVRIIPDLLSLPLSSIEPQISDGAFLFQVNINLAKPWNRYIKNAFDRVLSSIIIVLISPLLAVISLLVYLDDGPPVLYTQERIGRKGKKFRFYKFRTMYNDSDRRLKEYFAKNPKAKEEWNQFMKLKGDDPRVTRTGRIMRKFSLDELPQLFNVLKGDMSLVGPRPYLERELERMGIHKEIILRVKPGITGLWQISGRNELQFEDRLKLDEFYVRNWSFWLDIYILLKTVWVVITGQGAY